MALKAFDDFKTVKPVPFTRTTHPNAQWFPDASFGLFMHWGIHSVAGIQPSWAMIKGYPYGTDRSEYWGKGYYSLLTKFNPQNYDPDKWMEAAKKAGMTYAVLTTKHHDGYALWPSEYGEMSTKQYMGGRDLLRPYVDSCRKYGLKLGFYFSPRDWGYPGYPVSLVYGENYVNPRTPEQNRADYEKFFNYTIGQLSEILTRYGKIDELWFDGMGWDGINDNRTEQVLAWIRKLQPGIVINNRWDYHTGDFGTPEVEMPDTAPEGWWENCVIWSGHWGYSPDSNFQPAEWVLEKLVTARSWGGNILLNAGPAPDGTMREWYYKGCDELAAWMAHSKDSLIGAAPVKTWKKFSNTPLTRRGNIWYAHVLPSNKKAVEINDVTEPSGLKLMRTNEKIDYKYESGTISFTLPESMRADLDNVVIISWKKAPVNE